MKDILKNLPEKLPAQLDKLDKLIKELQVTIKQSDNDSLRVMVNELTSLSLRLNLMFNNKEKEVNG